MIIKLKGILTQHKKATFDYFCNYIYSKVLYWVSKKHSKSSEQSKRTTRGTRY